MNHITFARFFSVCFAVIMLGNCSVRKTIFPSFLEGTWKVENSNAYEEWEADGNDKLKGSSYKLEEGEKKTLEYLQIERRGKIIVYSATVPTQNEGRTIDFTMKQPDTQSFSFENTDHDFPKKIIYHPVARDTIFVEVLGDTGKGFSFRMHLTDKTGS